MLSCNAKMIELCRVVSDTLKTTKVRSIKKMNLLWSGRTSETSWFDTNQCILWKVLSSPMKCFLDRAEKEHSVRAKTRMTVADNVFHHEIAQHFCETVEKLSMNKLFLTRSYKPTVSETN